MSEDEIRISLKQIAQVLSYVKVAFGVAATALTLAVTVVVWVKLTDQQLAANTVAIEKMQVERAAILRDIYDTNAELKKIASNHQLMLEHQQKQLDRLTELLTRK